MFVEYAKQFQNDDELCQMILIANYIENEELLDLLTAALAIKLSKKNPSQIRDYFGITEPFANLED